MCAGRTRDAISSLGRTKSRVFEFIKTVCRAGTNRSITRGLATHGKDKIISLRRGGSSAAVTNSACGCRSRRGLVQRRDRAGFHHIDILAARARAACKVGDHGGRTATDVKTMTDGATRMIRDGSDIYDTSVTAFGNRA